MTMLLFEKRPELEKEWDFDLNEGINPYHLDCNSSKNVNWNCEEKSHSWQATVKSRANGSKCPYCTNKRVLQGFNDLQTCFPQIAAEWDYEKNFPLKPRDVVYGTRKRFYWLCEHGVSWEQEVSARTRSPNPRCPCNGAPILIKGVNDLATKRPDIAAEWDYVANAPITPSSIFPKSNKKFSWICSHEHHWDATVANRTAGYGCPYCQNQKPIVGENDLATLCSKLVKEWDYHANAPLTPEQCMLCSNKNVGWICKKGHHYTASIAKRTQRGDGCPYCSGRYPIPGETDLATTHPQLLKEWDYEANYLLTPQHVKAESNVKAHWICKVGHKWHASIANRTKATDPRGCPKCAHTIVSPGKTDLATVYPELLREWDWELNKIKPSEVFARSGKVQVHWICEKNKHRWICTPDERFSTGKRIKPCPQCPRNVSCEEKEVFDYISTLLPDEKIIQSNRGVLHGKELDIYIPGRNVAIEYNGLFWHSEYNGKGETYHLNKFLDCQKQGVNLLMVWENHWLNHMDIVQERLYEVLRINKPGVQTEGAENFHVEVLTQQQSKEFFKNHHLNSYQKATNCYALINNDGEVVSAMSFTLNKCSARIVQYASTQYIVNGMQTLLNAVITECSYHTDCEKIIANFDNGWSYENVFASIGFAKGKLLFPKQKFFTGTKYNTQINSPDEYDSKVATLWDCGTTQWIYKMEHNDMQPQLSK